MRLIQESHLEDSYWQCILMDTIRQLQINCTGSGTMKVKWNACYAIGNLMQNPVLFTNKARPSDWLNIVIPDLCRLMVYPPNFKVRINAAAALAAVPLQRSVIEDHLTQIWPSLLEALEQTDHMTDYAEYQHRDNLVDQVLIFAFIIFGFNIFTTHQLCITIANFISLLTVPDLPNVAGMLQRYDSIGSKWKRVVSRILPDKSAPLLNATRHLNELELSVAANSQRTALTEIRQCFVPLLI